MYRSCKIKSHNKTDKLRAAIYLVNSRKKSDFGLVAAALKCAATLHGSSGPVIYFGGVLLTPPMQCYIERSVKLGLSPNLAISNKLSSIDINNCTFSLDM